MGHNVLFRHPDSVHDHHLDARILRNRRPRLAGQYPQEVGRQRPFPMGRVVPDRPASIPECGPDRGEPRAEVQCHADVSVDQPLL